MSNKLKLHHILLFIIILTSCISTPGGKGSYLSGTWVMDEGEADYIDVVGFRIVEQEEQLLISFGEIINGEFDEQEGPVALVKQENTYSAELLNTRFRIEPDNTGLVFLGFSGQGSQLYHFKPLELNN